MSFEMNYTRSVLIAPCLSEDVYGARTYGTELTVPAIFSGYIKNIKDFRGNEFISSYWVAVPPDTAIAYNSKITIDGRVDYIGSIADVFDEEAEVVLYKEIYVGRVAPGEGSL